MSDVTAQSRSAPIESLADDVRRRRRELRLSQEDLGDLSQTSVRFIRDLEHGKPTVRLDKLLAVLGALGLELRADLRSP